MTPFRRPPVAIVLTLLLFSELPGRHPQVQAADLPRAKTRLAHVGLQLDGGWSFLNQELQEPDAEVVAVAEPVPELLKRARATTKRTAGVKFYTDYVKMLDEVKPDAVIATLPNSEHLALVRECAKRGIHVWFQKPMTTSLKDALEMQQLAKRAGIKLMINYFRLWEPAVQSLERHIAQGDLGTIQRVIVQAGYGTTHERKMSKYYLGYFWQPEKQSGGSLIEQGTYGIHWAVWLLGRPTRVFAVAKKLRTDAPFSAEDESWTLMDFPSATAISQGSWSMPDEATEGGPAIQIIGARGIVRMIHGKWTISTKANSGQPQPLDRPDPPRERKNGVAHFVDCIRNGKPIDAAHSTALNVTVTEVTDAAYLSIKTGRPVELPLEKVDDGSIAGELAGNKLLITMVRTSDTEVFVVDPQTGDAQNLSRSPASEDRYPCWSPDGKCVAFTSNRDGPYNLYVMDADGGNVKRLVNSTAVCYMPSWQHTAKGERIVFGLHGDKPQMASIKPDGTELIILGDVHDPTLSPDGKQICYTANVAGGVTVFVMDADGSNNRRVVKETSKVGATFPNWSPDSKQIVYSFPVGKALELFVINADGTGNRQLTKLGKICTPAAWSPDGNWISFRYTDERYWSDPVRMKKVYAEKPADKRPVWVIRPGGSDAHVIECLRFQCAIDGSRASWKPK